jgi:hypothetical protein
VALPEIRATERSRTVALIGRKRGTVLIIDRQRLTVRGVQLAMLFAY